ncbi:hypothetical protein KAW48_01975 [candidate division WOR-3 bacterium]|nr:hypothetical protein [candidate division WOR-3 bacterium]
MLRRLSLNEVTNQIHPAKGGKEGLVLSDCSYNLKNGGVSRVNKTYAPLPLGSGRTIKRCSSNPLGRIKMLRKDL